MHHVYWRCLNFAMYSKDVFFGSSPLKKSHPNHCAQPPGTLYFQVQFPTSHYVVRSTIP